MDFEITNRVITGDKNLFLISDNSDYVASFVFDEEWSGKTKTARFSNSKGNYVDVILNDQDACTIPCEVLKCGYVFVGVYSSEMVTTRHKVFVHKSIKGDDCDYCEPTPDIYEQLLHRLDEIEIGAGIAHIEKDLTSTDITLSAESNTNYIYGELASLNLSFNADGVDTSEINLIFKSGETATTLTVDSTNAVFTEFVPSANAIVEISAKWYVDKWIVLFIETAVA